jgi:crossover junction endodeoxyribonuclease RuvC
MNSIRILGIDPGLRVTGFGVIDKTGQKLAYVTSGCVRSNEKDALPLRLKTLLDGIGEVIATHRPDEAAIEKVFVNVNPQSTLLLGQARGAAIAALVLAGTLIQAVTTTALLTGLGAMFWFMVKAMARIQMPQHPPEGRPEE